MNTLLVVLVILAGLLGCGSAGDDPAQHERVEKQAQAAPKE